MNLPPRLGGFGLRMTSSLEADAALLSGAAMAQAASNGDKYFCLPFNGGRRQSYLAVWQRVYDETTNTRGWTADTRDLPAAFFEKVLPHVQHYVSQTLWTCDSF